MSRLRYLHNFLMSTVKKISSSVVTFLLYKISKSQWAGDQ
jgi:hypothetical protein